MQKSGFAEHQAEAIVSIVSDKHEELATKSDLEILRMDLDNFREATKTDIEKPETGDQSGIQESDSEDRGGIQESDSEDRGGIQESENRIGKSEAGDQGGY